MSVAQQFFSEREHTIKAANGGEFVKLLGELLDAAPSLDQGGLTPSAFEVDDIRYFFRGQTNGSYGINSSLYRALKEGIAPKTPPKRIEEKMKDAEERILLEARNQGIGRNLTSLELLTVLQHHLVPTRLIDVSASWKVALYFASEEKDQVDGRMFTIATKPSLWDKFSRPNGHSPRWPNKTEHPWQQTTWPVLLPFTDPRMISQQGYFLVGGLTTNVGGHHQYWNGAAGRHTSGNRATHTLTQKELREVSTLMIKFPMLRGVKDSPMAKLEKELKGTWTAVGLTIPIPGAFKPQIRETLKDEYGIHRDSIYPPIDESLRLLKHVAGSGASGRR